MKSFGYIPNCDIAWSHDKSIHNFLRSLSTVFVFSWLLLLVIQTTLKSSLFQHGLLSHHWPQTPTWPQVDKVYLCINPVDLQVLVSVLSFIPCALVLFLLLFQGSKNPDRKYLMEISYLWLFVPRSLILCIISGYESLYLFPSAAGESFSDDGYVRQGSQE